MKIQIIPYENYVKPTERAHYNDSGSDVYATLSTTIAPHTTFAMPLGFGVCLPDGYDIVIQCKSGLSKKGLWLANSPVDAGYRTVFANGEIIEKAEIHAILCNVTDFPINIERGMKVGQMVVRPVIYADFVTELGDQRNGGAFGSTGV